MSDGNGRCLLVFPTCAHLSDLLVTVKLDNNIFPEPSFSSNVVVWGSFSKIVRVNCFAILYSMLGSGWYQSK